MPKIKSLSFLFSPLLISTFPVLSFYVSNISELSLRFLNNLLPLTILGSICLTFVLYAITRDKTKSSLLSSIFLFVFFTYGHLSQILDDKLFIQLKNGIVIGPDKILLPLLFLSLVIVSIKIITSQRGFKEILSFISFSLVVLITYFSFIILSHVRNEKPTLPSATQPEIQAKNASTPDIYHLILDGYAREDVLQEIYGYDNSEFTKSLINLGFFVADKARANYIHTYISLPSTFNMTYLDFLPEEYGIKPSNDYAATNLLIDNEVSRKLKIYGYTTINFATWWSGTSESFKADITFNQDKTFKIAGLNVVTNETNMVFLQTTLLSPLVKEVWGQALRGKVLSTLQKLPDIPFRKGKKFTLVHITTPHPPYLFNSDGSPVPGSDVATADEGIDKRPLYLEQVKFITSQILPIIQKLIKNSENPPIIILQSDHGPASIFGTREEWAKNYSREALLERSSILYAVFFPDADYKHFSMDSTPVNTYRIIFNKYFGENYDLLPEKSFYTSYDAIYSFQEIAPSDL